MAAGAARASVHRRGGLFLSGRHSAASRRQQMTYYQAGPIYVTLLAALILKEHVGWRRWTAVAVGFVGVVIALSPPRPRSAGRRWWRSPAAPCSRS